MTIEDIGVKNRDLVNELIEKATQRIANEREMESANISTAKKYGNGTAQSAITRILLLNFDNIFLATKENRTTLVR
jgi:hypothetical protein